MQDIDDSIIPFEQLRYPHSNELYTTGKAH